MFEKYTEAARKAIFYARDNAHTRASAYIEPEHLMEALFRVHAATLPRVSPIWMDLRSAVLNLLPAPAEGSPKVDITLAHASKSVLAYAAEEGERLNHRHITDFHLWLGLLREKGTIPARLLHEYGVSIELLRSERIDLEHHVRQAARHFSTSLDLSGLEIGSIPSSLLNLSALTALLLANNNLENVPEEIDRLESLQYLDLRSNSLARLPGTLRNLQDLTVLLLEGNPRLGIPMEVLYKAGRGDRETLEHAGRLTEKEIQDVDVAPAKSIIDFYFRTAAEFRPLNELRMILVGRGSVGKTSLVHRLVWDRFNRNEKKTEGIQITTWNVSIGNGQDIRFNIWDFGGQEIMHATHQFFLSHRSVYLLVLNGRDGLEESDAEYWLRLIDSFGGESPVVVVLNKINEDPFTLNRRALQGKFPNIRDFVRTDCATGFGIASLRSIIERETQTLPDILDVFPASWFQIKERLQTIKRNYLTFDDYRKICEDVGEIDIGAQDRLADYLHSLGIALNYRDDPRLQETHILNPHWVTTGIYRIINSRRLEDQRGEISLAQVAQILDGAEYPPAMRRFLLDLMKRFDLCFSFPEDECLYLVPDLLDKQEPEQVTRFNPTEALNFQYSYPVLPPGILPRFIVRTQALSRRMPRWRTGVILEFEGNSALVKADLQERRTYVHIGGPQQGRRRLLSVIRSDFERIHSDIRNLGVKELVPVPEYPGVLIPYTDLLAWEHAGRKHYPVVIEGRVIDIDVDTVLNGIELNGRRGREAATSGRHMPIRLFLSYSHRDDVLRRELETHLKLLQREGVLDVWSDLLIDPGEHWKESIKNSLDHADVIVLLISSDFLASDYCYGIEMQQALEGCKRGDLVVIPVVVRDVEWRRSPIGHLQALPSGGKPVTAWSDRDSAWRDVAIGIEAAVKKMSQSRRAIM